MTGLFTAFVNNTTTADFGSGITVNSVSVASATTATVNLSISPLATVGNRTVTLTTGAQSASSLDAGSFFAVTAGNAAIGQVAPSTGRQAESLTVTITGVEYALCQWQHNRLVRRRHHRDVAARHQPDERDRKPVDRSIGHTRRACRDGDDARRDRDAAERVHGDRRPAVDLERLAVDRTTG